MLYGGSSIFRELCHHCSNTNIKYFPNSDAPINRVCHEHRPLRYICYVMPRQDAGQGLRARLLGLVAESWDVVMACPHKTVPQPHVLSTVQPYDVRHHVWYIQLASHLTGSAAGSQTQYLSRLRPRLDVIACPLPNRHCISCGAGVPWTPSSFPVPSRTRLQGEGSTAWSCASVAQYVSRAHVKPRLRGTQRCSGVQLNLGLICVDGSPGVLVTHALSPTCVTGSRAGRVSQALDLRFTALLCS